MPAPEQTSATVRRTKLLAERIAVALFKAKCLPINEDQRIKVAGYLLAEFEMRAKWETDRGIFERVGAVNEPVAIDHVDHVKHFPTMREREEQFDEVCRTTRIDHPADDPDNRICPTCNGKTHVCFTCGMPEGNCTHVGYTTKGHLVTCPVCNGTGRDPNNN